MELGIILVLLVFPSVNGNCSSILEEIFSYEHLMKTCGVRHDLKETKELSVEKRFAEMLHLFRSIAGEVKNLHLLMNTPQCDGLTLNTLPDLPKRMEEKADESISSALFYQIAHVFSISREHLTFPLTCSNYSEYLAYGFRKLGGKLLLLQCFINEDTHPPVIDDKHKTSFRFRTECSSRQTRDCIVLKRTLDLLNFVLPIIYRVNVTNQ